MDLTPYYLWLKALHIIAVMAWMAGMLYLPRLFVYHAGTAPGSEASEMLKVMERKLLRFIINPAMIAALILGIALISVQSETIMKEGWFHAKLTLLIVMFGLHGWFSALRKRFAHDANVHSAKFYKWLNEVPTLLLIGIVLLAVLKPF